jgi:hypothetical protein
VYRFEGNFIGIVNVFRWFLGYFKLEYFALFIGFDEIVAAVELVFDDGFTVFTSQTFGIAFFCLFGIHTAYNFFPFGNRVSFAALCIDQDHDTALAAKHVS